MNNINDIAYKLTYKLMNVINISQINININFHLKTAIEKDIRENINKLIEYIENEVSSEDYKKEYIDTISLIKEHIIDKLPSYLDYNYYDVNIANSYKSLIETIIYIMKKIDTPLRKLKISKEVVKTIKRKCSYILENQNKIEFYSYIYNYFYNSYNHTFFAQDTQNKEELKVKIKEILNKDIELFLALMREVLFQNQQEILNKIKISPLLNEIKDLLYKLDSYINEKEVKLIENHN